MHFASRQPAAESGDSRFDLRLAALVLVPTFLVYLVTLGFPFVFDDLPQIVENPFILSWRSLPGYFGAQLWNTGWGATGRVATFYRPLLFVWLLLNRTLFGVHPFFWHLTTVLLHLAATLLVCRLAWKLTADKGTALIAGLLFGIHPVHIEGVAWVSGATEPLGAVLILGAVSCVIAWRQQQSHAWFGASLAVATLALLAKETALVIPALVGAYVWFFDPPQSVGARLISTVRAVVPFALLDAAYYALRISIFGGLPAPLSTLPWRTLILTWPSVLYFDLKHLVWPAGLSLLYDTPYVTTMSADFWRPLAMLLVVALLSAMLAWKARPVVAFAFLWMLASVVPTLDFRMFRWREIAHDRYLYLPSVGFVLIVAYLLRRLRSGERKLFEVAAAQFAAVVVLCVAMASSTVAQSGVWGSQLLLFHHAFKTAPNNVSAATMLAAELAARGHLAEATELYRRVSQLAPNWSEGWSRLGETLMMSGRYDEAGAALVRATSLDPRNDQALYLLAQVRLRQQRPVDAEALLHAAIGVSHSTLGYHLQLGELLQQRGDLSAARAEFRQVLMLQPGHPQAQEHLQAIDSRQ